MVQSLEASHAQQTYGLGFTGITCTAKGMVQGFEASHAEQQVWFPRACYWATCGVFTLYL
jgi:hypothetical protein